MSQYAFHLDTSRCTGCKTCELACKDYHDLGVENTIRRVYDYEGGEWEQGSDGGWTTTSFVYRVSESCNHCDNPACVENCPTGVMHKDPDNGLVTVTVEDCIGCGTCAMSCPYGAPFVDADSGHSVKCDGCAARVAEGKPPICVDACLMRALEFGDAEEMATKGERANVCLAVRDRLREVPGRR